MQELDGKRRETTIYTGSARWKVTAPYVQSGVDSILCPALFVVRRLLKLIHEMLGGLSMRDPWGFPRRREKKT